MFAGIGGLELGLQMALPELEVVLQCEWEPWNRELLAQRFPGVKLHDDIRTLEAHHGERPDLICGGFPCQDISNAGKRAGLAGEKSGLWWEQARIIAETRPRFYVGENVASILSDRQRVVPPRADWLGDPPAVPLFGALGAVLWTLAALGYDATWDCVPAGALGAPHRRDRWFLVAYSQGWGRGQGGVPFGVQAPRPNVASGGLAHPAGPRLEGHSAERGTGSAQLPQPPAAGVWQRALAQARDIAQWAYLGGVGGAADGVPGGVDQAGVSFPTVRATEWKRAGYQNSSSGGKYETLGGACGAEPMPFPAGDRPIQPWEGGEPRVKPHGPHWKPRLRALGNAVVPVAGAVPGFVVRELLEAA